MRTICFDFGNSRLKAALFNEQMLVEEIAIENDNTSTFEALLDQYSPDKSILSSVIRHNEEIETLLAAKSRFHKLGAGSKLNFTISVSKPETIGPDRISLIAAAMNQFPKSNTLVIGMGSCITYNFVNQYGQFLGGAISPGMEMRFKAMHEYTAKLPLVQPFWNVPLIGFDTKTNLQSGVIIGITGEMEGFIEKYQNKYNCFNVVLTGGNSSYFASQLKKNTFADSNFLFKGLYALSELNNQQIE
jgi:type III pantothenate kinase